MSIPPHVSTSGIARLWPQSTYRGGPVILLAAGSLAVFVGVIVAYTDAPLLSAAITGCLLAVPILVRSKPQTWLGLLVLVIALDGLVKLAFWPSIWPQLITPIVLSAAYLRTVLVRSDLSWLETAMVPLAGLGVLTVLGLLSLLIHGELNILAGAVGIYTWVAFAPLAWVGATLFSNKADLERAIRWVLLLAVPIAVAAAIQYAVGAVWYASLGPGFSQATFGVAGFSGEGVFRVNGTFTAPGHLAGFMIPITFISIAALLAGVSRSTVWAGGIGLVASAVTLFTNNQRSWVVILVVGLPLLFLMTRSTVKAGRWLRLGATLVGGLSVGAVLAGPALLDRLLTIAIDPVQVILGSTLGDFGVLKLASILDAGTLLGNGPGTATIGARYFGPVWELTENYFANAYYELGPFGLLAVCVTILTVVFITFRAWLTETDLFVRTVLAATVVYQAALVVISISYSPLAYPPSAVFFWVGGGVAVTRLASSRPGGGTLGWRSTPSTKTDDTRPARAPLIGVRRDRTLGS